MNPFVIQSTLREVLECLPKVRWEQGDETSVAFYQGQSPDSDWKFVVATAGDEVAGTATNLKTFVVIRLPTEFASAAVKLARCKCPCHTMAAHEKHPDHEAKGCSCLSEEL